MKWVTYRSADGERAGLVVDDRIHGLSPGTTVNGLLGDDGEKMHSAAETARSDPFEVLDFDGADLAAPVRPPQIRDFLTFLDHLRNARAMVDMDLDPAWEEIPAFYFSNVAAVTGPYDDVAISPGCEQFDFELEIAAIVGRAGSNLTPEEAEDHIVGFTIFGDWSARDLQRHEMRLSLGPSKGKDGANTLGPMLVTKDELEPLRSKNSFHAEMTALVNGETIGHGFMDQMDWSFGEIVSYASRGTEVRPGDAICSGTVPTGCLAEHFATKSAEDFPGWLEPGDVVRFEVEVLGATEQTVLEAPPVHRLRTGF